MLVIRNEQMQVLRSSRRQTFLERLVAHLELTCPAACAELDDGELPALVDRQLRRGMAFGISAERELVLFVSVMLVVGASREDAAWLAQVQRYLTDKRVPLIGERVARLYSATLRRLDVEASNRRILQEIGLAQPE